MVSTALVDPFMARPGLHDAAIRTAADAIPSSGKVGPQTDDDFVSGNLVTIAFARHAKG
jgi:hypothetical protein